MNRHRQQSAPVNNARLFLLVAALPLLFTGKFAEAAILAPIFILLEILK